MTPQSRFNYISKTGREPMEAERPKVNKTGWALYQCGVIIFGPTYYHFCRSEANRLNLKNYKIKPYER